MLEPTKERADAAAFRQTPPWSERTVRFRDWRGTGFQHPGGLNATDAEWITFGLPTPRPVHTQLLRKVCDGDVSFLSPLRDTCTITYVDKTVETFVSVKRLRSASRDGGFAVLAAPEPKAKKSLLRWKRGDRVEVKRGKTWAKRTVRSLSLIHI